jgi:aryl-alcohol dehydrogenase-like predicted oxidoreductase
MTDRTLSVTQVYLDLAKKHGIDPVHMALAWQRTRPFPVSAIFGATNTTQLEHILAGREIELDGDIVSEINNLHRSNPAPF